MAVRSFRAAMLVFVLPAFLAGSASAQAPNAPPPAANTPAPAAPATGAPAPATGAPAAPSTGAGTGTAAPPGEARPQGYGYADPKPVQTQHRRVSRAPGPVATLPGFEMLPDGGSRFFVEMTQNVPVEEKKAAGTITYVIKGEHVAKMNNENALVTVHFNTPVSRARLLPSGRDLHFVLELRANVTPTFKVTPAKDGSAILQIEFPKGNFLPNGDSDQVITPTADADSDDSESTTRKRGASVSAATPSSAVAPTKPPSKGRRKH